MKRLLIVLLCVALACSLVACGGNKKPVTEPSTSEQGSTTTTASTESADSTTGDKTEPSKTESTAGKTDPTKTENTTTTTTTTTKKPTSANKPTQTQPSDNSIDWENTFGSGTTADNGTTTTTTTTTTAPTTTTTVPPTKVEEVILPAVGTDVDVVKMKGRIRISDIKLEKSVLTITIKNESDNWITQETDWVKYTCYDKDGKALSGEGEFFGYIYLGCLECGDSITSTVTLPAGTVKVEITDCEIVYWTPWK